MARGWESKSVESQIEAAATRRAQPPRTSANAVDLVRQREYDSLQLSRVRILHQLETAQNPRYTEMLKKALTDLEIKLNRIKPVTDLPKS